MSDPLFSIKNNFFLGAYNAVINEASSLHNVSPNDAIDRDCYLYRSYIALGSHDLVIQEVSDSASTALLSIKLLAQYLSGKKNKAEVISTLQEWLSDLACNRNPTVLFVAGSIYVHENMFPEALRCCHKGFTLEMSALCVQVYIKMDRVDKAEQQLKAMATQDDDATLTQLATAWVGVALGGSKIQEASYIYQELGDKYTWTPLLLNGRAICAMKRGEWEDAERDLLEALGKDAKDSDTLANLSACGLHLGRNVQRYQSQLKMLQPNHPYIKHLEVGEELFQRVVASVS
uniref:Coatomer subunit epsilon n=1 Tax=Polytomella parva TaxID=51329 RepID=A0A7S0VBN2_9CHLO|mmetsp:Transcript_34906/g.62764  ORF Transcript_34906/g.62764 Transcript_34906/m.62764 type:complete len:289 (+) Transcript_34906:76-942(+)|eukprot:CAMPEP_0175065242 /NCGR_PEP_ID=MMETSP0052_2-20121109/15806_1 /TAXON_ID=51329 ORGANISM="Polytomella parva, Strain SAG 63-3" /NCGR_SAMPLE_ID=MMETSP0052_2 /ASSEMBLY_ACC=CAM_ASM_000194 /LENGTH=288 /DNA_ID=CAMNT_0016331735 /DNA_START=47 /DNA_END=913 /DNA_ORIENTATION=-